MSHHEKHVIHVVKCFSLLLKGAGITKIRTKFSAFTFHELFSLYPSPISQSYQILGTQDDACQMPRQVQGVHFSSLLEEFQDYPAVVMC